MNSQNKPVTFLVGAGVSRDAPTSALLWSEIREVLAQRILQDAARYNLMDLTDLATTIDVFMAEAPRPDTLFSIFASAGAVAGCREVVRECLGTGIPNRNHFAIASACRCLRPFPIILSANYDGYLESAFASLDCSYLLANDDFSQVCMRESPVIFKLHGSIETNPDDLGRLLRDFAAVIATERGLRPTFLDIKEPEPVLNSIGRCLPDRMYVAAQRALADALICVLGYSGADPDIMPILSRSLAESESNVLWIVHPGYEPPTALEELRSRYGGRIETVHSSVTEFLSGFVGLRHADIPKQPAIEATSEQSASADHSNATSPTFSLSDVIAITLGMANALGDTVRIDEFLGDIESVWDRLPAPATAWLSCIAANYLAARGLISQARSYLNRSKHARRSEGIGVVPHLDMVSESALAFWSTEVESAIAFMEGGPAASIAVIRDAWEHDLSHRAEVIVPASVRESFLGHAVDSAAAANRAEECLEFGSILLRVFEREYVSENSLRSLLLYASFLYQAGQGSRSMAILETLIRYAQDCGQVETLELTSALIDHLRDEVQGGSI